MQHIHFFRQDTVDLLKKNVTQNLPWYRGGSDADQGMIEDRYNEMSLPIDLTCFDVLNKNTAERDDRKNVIAIYEAFGCLSLQQAAEERIWAYATHFLARQYTSKRWGNIPKDDGKAVRYILAHYFVSGARGLFRDNAIARLWWMGYLASRCDDYDLENTLNILLRDSDVRANLLERTSVSMSVEMFSGVVRALGKSLERGENPDIYKRNNFRNLMKAVNRRGGRIMLNALTNKQLDEILNSMVKQITQN